jgi:hypothetical protein
VVPEGGIWVVAVSRPRVARTVTRLRLGLWLVGLLKGLYRDRWQGDGNGSWRGPFINSRSYSAVIS